MKFDAKLLNKTAATEVYVLLEREKKNTELWYPVGVVTNKASAQAWYAQNSNYRDWKLFQLDVLPEEIEPIQPPSDQQRRLEEARKSVETKSQQLQESIKNLKK